MATQQGEWKIKDRFILGDKIASGGMATVYGARVEQGDELYGRELAVKVLHEHLSDDGDFVRMFRDEGGIARRFSHPNIVKVHEVGVENGRYFIVMERIDGWNLAQILRAWKQGKKRVPKAAVYEILRQSLTALVYVHTFKGNDGKRLSIVHRDISPQNILVSRDGSVKLADFGIARGQHRSDRTRTGTVKGKMHYMAPEQAAGKRVGARADLYSVGAVAYECFLGKPLFGPGRTEVLRARAIRGEIDFGKGFGRLHAELQAWLAKCLAVDPKERFQSAEAMLAAMENIKGAHASRFKTDVLDRLLNPPAPIQGAQEQALFTEEEMRPTGPLSLPIPEAQERDPAMESQRPISGSFVGTGAVSVEDHSEESRRLMANSGPPDDWSPSKDYHLRPSSSALHVVLAADSDKSKGRRRRRRSGNVRGELQEAFRHTGSYVIEHDDRAVQRGTAVALQTAGMAAEVPDAVDPKRLASKSRDSGVRPKKLPFRAVKMQSRVFVEQQRGQAFVVQVAFSCMALLLFGVFLEIWNAQVRLPQVDAHTFSGLFFSSDERRASSLVSERVEEDTSQGPLEPVVSDPAPRPRVAPAAPELRNDVFLPRLKSSSRDKARRKRSHKKHREAG